MGGGGVLNFEVRGDLPGVKLRAAGVSHMKLWGRVSLAEETAHAKGKCKGPEARMSLASSENRKEPMVAEVE